MNVMTFGEYCQYREGLWLNDKNAVVGLSKIAPPTPPKKTRQPAPPRIKPVHAPAPAKPMGEVQLPDALTMMAQLGISPVEPSRDQMKRLVDKAKNRVVVSQRFNDKHKNQVAASQMNSVSPGPKETTPRDTDHQTRYFCGG